MDEKRITRFSLFEGKKIRKTWHNDKWWFVILDVIAALTDSVQPDGYLKDMRRRDDELSKGFLTAHKNLYKSDTICTNE